MDIRAAEISSILKTQIANFGADAEVTEVGQILSVGGAEQRLGRAADGRHGEQRVEERRRVELVHRPADDAFLGEQLLNLGSRFFRDVNH